MSVLVSDSFNRANNATSLGSTDSYAGGTTYTWSHIGTAVWGINNNQAYESTGANDSPAYVDMSTQADNVKISVDIQTSSGIYLNGVAFRIQDTNNYFRCYATTGWIKIDRMLNGSATTIVNTSLTGITVPFTISVGLSSSTITYYVNGVQEGTVTDTNLTAATKHGMYIGNSTTIQLDNFKIESLNTATTQNASASGGSTSGGTSSSLNVAVVSATASGGSNSGGTVNVTYTQNTTASGGSVSGGTSSSIQTLNASVSGGSTSGGTASSLNVPVNTASASGGSSSGGTASSTQATIIYVNATAAGGSASGGSATSFIVPIVTASASGGSVSGGTVATAAVITAALQKTYVFIDGLTLNPLQVDYNLTNLFNYLNAQVWGINIPVQTGATSLSITGLTQVDNNYMVVPTTSWLTSYSIIGKTSTGFTINFGSAAPSNASLDWRLMR